MLIMSQYSFLLINPSSNQKELLMTWGVDGKVCLWDSFSVGDAFSPLCTLISRSNYPVFALDIAGDTTNLERAQASDNVRLAVAGGDGDGGFLGVPAYLYDI